MNATIIYDKDFPEFAKAEIDPLLQEWLWLLPKWCQMVSIGWHDKSECEGECVNISISYSYRNVRIRFFSLFHTAENKREMIGHELVHSQIGMLADYARYIIEMLATEDEHPILRQHLQEQLTERHESVTQDFAYCLNKKFE